MSKDAKLHVLKQIHHIARSAIKKNLGATDDGDAHGFEGMDDDVGALGVVSHEGGGKKAFGMLHDGLDDNSPEYDGHDDGGLTRKLGGKVGPKKVFADREDLYDGGSDEDMEHDPLVPDHSDKAKLMALKKKLHGAKRG